MTDFITLTDNRIGSDSFGVSHGINTDAIRRFRPANFQNPETGEKEQNGSKVYTLAGILFVKETPEEITALIG